MTPAASSSPRIALGMPAEEGVRRTALEWLAEASEAKERLAQPSQLDSNREATPEGGDSEALHDFRVALRRLRSTLKTFRATLEGSVGKKLERRLKRLADSTGGGRDSEVEIAWVETQVTSLTPAERRGAEWWLVRLKERCAREYASLGDVVEKRFGSLAESFVARLSTYRAEIRLRPRNDHDDRRETYGALISERLRDLGQELDRRLQEVASADDVEAAHEARIVGKRLRYLLEPCAESDPAAHAVVARIKKLQEILGELHDSHVLEADLASEFVGAAASNAKQRFEIELEAGPARRRAAARRPLEAGLLALATRNRERRDALFSKLEKGWLGGSKGRAKAFFQELDNLADTLAGPAPEPTSETAVAEAT